MDIEELKKKEIFVQYILPDNPPKLGLQHMQYYTCFAEDPNNFYFGLSIGTKEKKETLERWVEEKKLIKLPEAKRLLYKKDLFLDTNKRIIMASGWDPFENQEIIHQI